MNDPRKNTEGQALNWRDFLAIALLVAIVLAYFWRLLWASEFIYGELDIRRSLYLFKKVAYDAMRQGEFPLWMPYLYCGMPLLASFLSTPFYPVDLAFVLLGIPLPVAFNWDLLFHLTTAQVFSFLFFRRLYGSRTAALFCSMWFWNVFFLGSIATGDALNIRAMLLLPAVFYFVEAGLGESGRPWHFLLGSLAVSMQMLCGGLQVTFYTLAGAAAYAVFLLATRVWRKEKFLGQAFGFAIMIACALAIASVHLLPAWEYSRLSVRATGIQWFRVWALEPHQLLDYVIPMFEGEGKGHGYFGITAIVLAAYSLFFWKDKRKYFFAALAAVSLLYSLGGNTRVSSLLAGLPLVRDFRGPFRGSILFNFSVFAVAGGILAGRRGQASAKGRRGNAIRFAIIAAMMVAGFVAATLLARHYSETAREGAIVSALFLALSIILASHLLNIPDHLKVPARFALVLLLACELAVNSPPPYSPPAAGDMFREDSTARFLREKTATSRIAVYNTAHSNYFGLFGIEAANGHHPFPTARYAEFLRLLKNPKIASLAGVSCNVYYHLGENGLPYNPPIADASQVTIEAAPTAPLPRAFLVEKYRVLPPERVLEAMQDGGFDPSREVIL
ncbi:MAG: hypothetical protein HY801_02270, partial [Candidatus Lindowbacteria bacterium]|nr:hypothetical protein [Candidatus Lindowbacteria bacterium]